MEQRPAPVVTISDPTRPGEPVDVMVSGTEREPWRPTRRHWALVGVLTLLAAAAVVPDKVVSARADEQRAERLAVAGIDLTLSTAVDPGGPDALRMMVTNAGPSDVQVQELQVDGYPTQRADLEVGKSSSTTVDVRDAATCGNQLLAPGTQTGVRLRVRTPGGTVVDRRIDLTGDTWLALNALAQKRCDYRPPGESLAVEAVPRRVGDHVDVRLALQNRGPVPLRLDFVNVPGGFGYRTLPNLPVTLPARQSRSTSLLLRVTVDDCSGAQGGVLGAPMVALVAVVVADSQDYDTGEVQVTEDAQPWLEDLVRIRCGG